MDAVASFGCSRLRFEMIGAEQRVLLSGVGAADHPCLLMSVKQLV
ncbi:hypothetical protein [Streptomyces sp. AM6-12]